MPTFVIEKEGWKSREPVRVSVLFSGMLKKYKFVAGGPDSTEEITTFEQYKQRQSNENIYLVPKSPPTVAKKEPKGTPVNVRVATWAQDPLDLQPGLDARLVSLEKKLSNVNVEGGADIFLASEYLFGLTREGEHETQLQPIGESDLGTFVKRIKNISKNFPRTVIVAGSIVWREYKSASKQGRCRNSAFVLYNGQLIESNAGSKRYDKAAVDHYESRFFNDLEWTGGPAPYFDFVHPALNLNCRLQLCADHGTRTESADAPKPDLQLVVAHGYGLTSSAETHLGGWCVHVDGAGFTRTVRAFDNAAEVVRTPLAVHELKIYKQEAAP